MLVIFKQSLQLLSLLLSLVGIFLSNTALAHSELPASDLSEEQITELISKLSPADKVGQLLMIGFSGTTINPEIKHWVQKRHVGGVALFSRNIVNLTQTARLTRALTTLSKTYIPLFIALDQEGGTVIRIKEGVMPLPSNMALGATRSGTLAYIAGQGMGSDLRLLGFNMNLAPVVDVNSNPQNPVIGMRSYGEKPELVSELGTWYIRGQQEMGIIPVAKHFPGHGATQTDSHFALPSINRNLEQLENVELLPFKTAIEKAALQVIMTAHIQVPKIAEQSDLPATLSHRILNELLRQKLHFPGVIITDGLEMQGVSKNYSIREAAILSILAGADMPLVLWDEQTKEDVYQGLLTAVEQGQISTERLDESVRRILRVKANYRLFSRKDETLKTLLARAEHNPTHKQVSLNIAKRALTLVRNRQQLLPLKPQRYHKITLITPQDTPFSNHLKIALPKLQIFNVPLNPSKRKLREKVEEVLADHQDTELFIIAALNRYQIEIARALKQALPQIPMALVNFTSPYYLTSIPKIEAYVCTYSQLDISQLAAAKALLGQIPMTGKLPVSIPGMYKYGHRLIANKQPLDNL